MIPLEAIEKDPALLKQAVRALSPKVLGSILDLTDLRPIATEEDTKKLCELANRFGSTICIHPSALYFAGGGSIRQRIRYPRVRAIATVIDFPFGAQMYKVKGDAVFYALSIGAQEIDMVLDISRLVQGDFSFIFEELDYVADILLSVQSGTCECAILKVIQENCYLSDMETKRRVIHIISSVAERKGIKMFAKTSTGFGLPVEGKPNGATLEDVWYMTDEAEDFGARRGTRVGIKASGGIRNSETAVKMMLAGGCFHDTLELKDNLPSIFRIGTSAGEKIMSEFEEMKKQVS